MLEGGVIQRIDLTDQVYEAVKTRLLTRDLGPGTKLSLQALADELAVSRTPVHHALTRLVSEGLVEVDRRGYRVRPLTGALITQGHDVRCALELFAAEQTVGRLSQDQLAGFRQLLDHTVELVENFEFVDKHAYVLANKEFHEYLVDLADNASSVRDLPVAESARADRACHRRPDAGCGQLERGARGDRRRRTSAAISPRRGAAIIANVETGKQLALEMIEALGGS